jgi:ubiquinol-cytochrome c reductase cytochrome b subunit
MFKWWFWVLVADFMFLMWLGAMPAEPLWANLSLIGTAYWFGYFLVILPLLGVIEKPLARPATIEEAYEAEHGGTTGGGSGKAPAATPAE